MALFESDKLRYTNGHGEPLGIEPLFQQIHGELMQAGNVVFYPQNGVEYSNGIPWDGVTGTEWLEIKLFGGQGATSETYADLVQKPVEGPVDKTFFVLERAR